MQLLGIIGSYRWTMRTSIQIHYNVKVILMVSEGVRGSEWVLDTFLMHFIEVGPDLALPSPEVQISIMIWVSRHQHRHSESLASFLAPSESLASFPAPSEDCSQQYVPSWDGHDGLPFNLIASSMVPRCVPSNCNGVNAIRHVGSLSPDDSYQPDGYKSFPIKIGCWGAWVQAANRLGSSRACVCACLGAVWLPSGIRSQKWLPTFPLFLFFFSSFPSSISAYLSFPFALVRVMSKLYKVYKKYKVYKVYEMCSMYIVYTLNTVYKVCKLYKVYGMYKVLPPPKKTSYPPLVGLILK